MKKVIFDVDGVLLSEKRYFDVSALVVWEWYYSPRYMHLKPERITADLDDDTIAALRAASGETTISYCGSRNTASTATGTWSTPTSSSPCGSCWKNMSPTTAVWKGA